jgi:hypothetical protein
VLSASLLSESARLAERSPAGLEPPDAAEQSREAQLGRGVMLQLRNANVVVDDQLTEHIGSSAASSRATRTTATSSTSFSSRTARSTRSRYQAASSA